jgi:UDP-glucose 4-epimerase
MSRKILISGGFGYVGGRIASYLYQKSFSIRLGSRNAQAAPIWLKDAETASIDLSDVRSLEKSMDDIYAVIHLAAMNEIDSIGDPQSAVSVNTIGTLNMLEASINSGVKQFFYFSTAHVYGAPLVGNISEYTVPKATHPYAITHRSAEDFVYAANQQKKIRGTIVRLSNSFGSPAGPQVNRWSLLVNDLCKQLVETKEMVLFSTGTQNRDFITLTDVGRAVDHLMNLPENEIQDGLFNLGGETTLSVFEMAQRIKSRCQIVLGFDPKIIRPESHGDDKAPGLNFDVSKLRKTGFLWLKNIDEEIDSTLRMCEKYYSI